jgi:ferredoxin-NADP reductase
MEEQFVKIVDIEQLTHDVKRFRVEKPPGYSFTPGQATELSINTKQWKDEKRPFTFTSLLSEPYLEFTIKIYPLHHGLTGELDKLKTGDELIIRDVWGAISYKGQGLFIAGGAGITPFLSIFRNLAAKNEIAGNLLIFANKTKADIILENELKILLGKDLINILSEEKMQGYEFGLITESILRKTIDDSITKFYVCGPPPMMDSVLKHLNRMGVGENSITLEL